MAYEKRVVAFIDFLGFKNIVSETVKDQSKLDKLIEALSYTRKHFEPLDFEHPLPQDHPSVTHFSDSIIFSFPYSAESGVFMALHEIQLFLIELTFKGFICRGGITIGDLIHDGDMAFGPAFISAYELENKKAKFPRVIVSENVLLNAAKYHANHHSSEMELGYIDGLVTQDIDGEWYIDYFGKALSELDDPEYYSPDYADKIIKIINDGLMSTDENVLEKYRWMATKYDEMVNFDQRLVPSFAHVPAPIYDLPAPTPSEEA